MSYLRFLFLDSGMSVDSTLGYLLLEYCLSDKWSRYIH